VLAASHGEFPRFVIAPGTVEQCFEAGHRAFNLAEKYQTPVIILSDLMLSNQQKTVEMDGFDFSQVTIDRGETLEYEALDTLVQPYERHFLTESGISPRAIPGHEKAVYITTGDEHNHEGFITEDGDVRNQQMEKRMRKETLAARDDMRLPHQYGPEQADVTLVGFGSTTGALIEAAERLTADGVSTNVLQFVDIAPLDEDRLTDLIVGLRRMVVVEQNYTGQLARVIRRMTGRKADARINKYDGRPISPTEIVTKVRQEVLAHV
jgi:2-oxoglutarate ferredoxin oxidoreductase subunit alpha